MSRLALLSLLLLAPQEPGTVPNVAYYEAADRDEKKHKLNLFVPAGKGPFPVLMWIHGGSWKVGDRALFKNVGEAFAKRGILTACISYRLSPQVQHPEHIRDCARAFAWLRAHAKEHGGDPARLFVMGQSAGGHLAALLALNTRYLEEQKLKTSDIKAVISISGVYRIGPVLPDVFPPEVRDDAEPVRHVREGAPPFFVLWGDGDLANLRLEARGFIKRLEEVKNDLKTLEVTDRNHISIVTKIGSEDDELTAAVAKYVLERK